MVNYISLSVLLKFTLLFYLGDLTKPLNWAVVAQHNDKIIQAKWHPTEMSFITTSADRTAIVWSLPTNDSLI
jgi:hypothetical protein